jgi:hypothetical protein
MIGRSLPMARPHRDHGAHDLAMFDIEIEERTSGVIASGAIATVGYWSALTAFLAVVAYDIAQLVEVLGLVGAPLDGSLI